jgi:hypothetical protein
MSNEFYVYVLLDPRKEFIPFYVGKGKGDRKNDTLRERSNRGNTFKSATIKKDCGLKPIVSIWDDNLPESKAFEIEKELISRFGRRSNNKNGILTNLTDGGEGNAGRKFTEKQRLQMITNNPGGLVTSKPVYQISSSGDILRTWPSMRSAMKGIGLKRKGSSCTCKEGSRRKMGGFYWRQTTTKEIINGKLCIDSINKKLYTYNPLYQICPKTGSVLNEFIHTNHAKKCLGIRSNNIGNKCRDACFEIVAGFLWRRVGSIEVLNGKLVTLSEFKKTLLAPHISATDQKGHVTFWFDYDEVLKNNPHIKKGSLRNAIHTKKVFNGMFWKVIKKFNDGYRHRRHYFE